MGSFKIIGGKKLKGELVPQGAKNEALQVLSAVLLSPEEITIHNIPDIMDVKKLIELLGDLGVKTKKINDKGSWSFKADDLNLEYLDSKEFRQKGGSLRGSIMIIGPLLTRFGKGYIPSPGGDKIGRRRLDTHFIGFEKLGAHFEFLKDENFYEIEKNIYLLRKPAKTSGLIETFKFLLSQLPR